MNFGAKIQMQSAFFAYWMWQKSLEFSKLVPLKYPTFSVLTPMQFFSFILMISKHWKMFQLLWLHCYFAFQNTCIHYVLILLRNIWSIKCNGGTSAFFPFFAPDGIARKSHPRFLTTSYYILILKKSLFFKLHTYWFLAQKFK